MARITVMDGHQALRYVDGRFSRVLGPGRHRYWRRLRTRHILVDLRERLTVVPGQEVLTADGQQLKLSAVLTWRVIDPVRFVAATADPEQPVYVAAQLALRSVVSSRTLDDLLADPAGLAEPLSAALAQALPDSDGSGVVVSALQVRDIMLGQELRAALAAPVRARQEGRAALERARAEAAVLRSLANSARLLEDHPGLRQLRTAQVAGEAGGTVVITAG